MPVDDAEAVLRKLPYAWDLADLEQAKQLFRNSRPTVSRHLVTSLWRFWVQRSPTEPLFGDTEDDLALVLHARAMGLHVPAGGGDDKVAELARRAQDPAVSGPLFREPLVWGPRAALAPQVQAALASSLVRVWVATDDQGPVEALVVGAGLPEIRHQVVQAALTTSLRVNGLTDPQTRGFVGDHIGVGLIRVTSGLAGDDPAAAIPSVFDARQVAMPDRSSSTARGALRDFVTRLRALERQTNLVQVTEIDHADLVAAIERLRALAHRAATEMDRAFLRSPTGDGPTSPGLVTLQPYLRTARGRGASAGETVGLELSPDIVATEAYRSLELAHQRVLAQRLTMDAKLRRDQLEAEIEWLTGELEAFTRASPEERLALWGSTVVLVERFDERMGVTIRLSEPEELDTELYFTTNMPQLIAMRRVWAQRMAELVEHLETAVHRPHGPAQQLAVGRFVDAVLRGVVPDESPATERAFARWRHEVAPMLWFEWRCALRRYALNPADLFTPHTVLVTRYLPPTPESPAVFFTHPYTLVDEARSAVLADAERGVLVVRDGTDHAEPVGADTTESTSGTDAVWAELARLAGQPSSQEAFNQTFLEALRTYPRESVQRMIEELRPAEPTATEADTIDQALRRADRATSISDGMDRALVAMRTAAFLTARECLDGIHGAPQWEARAWLLRAIMECVADDISYHDVPDVLGNQVPGMPAGALRALNEAASLDEEFTHTWLRVLSEIDLDKGIRRLFQGLPRARASCADERQYAVWLFRRAIQSARLAQQLEEAAEELNEEQEAVDIALVKLGRALEDILIGPYVGAARGEAQGLFEVLTRQEPPKYGRVVR